MTEEEAEVKSMMSTYPKLDICKALISSRRKLKRKMGEVVESKRDMVLVAEALGFLPENAKPEDMIAEIRVIISNQKET